MKQRRRGPALSKAELRAQAEQAAAATNKPILKLPTKVVRQCGRCGEPSTVIVDSAAGWVEDPLYLTDEFPLRPGQLGANGLVVVPVLAIKLLEAIVGL